MYQFTSKECCVRGLTVQYGFLGPVGRTDDNDWATTTGTSTGQGTNTTSMRHSPHDSSPSLLRTEHRRRGVIVNRVDRIVISSSRWGATDKKRFLFNPSFYPVKTNFIRNLRSILLYLSSRWPSLSQFYTKIRDHDNKAVHTTQTIKCRRKALGKRETYKN